MTLEEEMALAILRGDAAAACALADLLCERRAAGGTPILPIKKIGTPPDRLRVAVFLKAGIEAIDIDGEAADATVADWLAGRQKAVVLQGVSRIEIYELPEAPHDGR